MKELTKKILFFASLTVLYILFFIVSKNWIKNLGNFGGKMSLVLVGIVFAIIMFGVYYLMDLQQENFANAFNISPGALCKGSEYLFQGDDETSKMCRDMAQTPDGRCDISRFNCPHGYDGSPKNTFDWEYTSNSDSCWSGVKCKGGCNVDQSQYARPHPPNCDCGTCAMWV